MSPEAVVSRMLPGVEMLLKAIVGRGMAWGTAPMVRVQK